MSKNNQMQLFSFLGLLAVYGIAFGLDRWIEYLRDGLSMGHIFPNVLFEGWGLANIVLAICVLSLYTWAMPRFAPWAIGCIVVFGLLINFVPLIYWLPLGYPLNFLSLFITSRGYLVSAGGWTAIAGLLTLLRKRAGS